MDKKDNFVFLLYTMIKISYLYHILIVKNRSSHKRCSVKKVFLKISQNSQESTCARVSFLIMLQALIPLTEVRKCLFHFRLDKLYSTWFIYLLQLKVFISFQVMMMHFEARIWFFFYFRLCHLLLFVRM